MRRFRRKCHEPSRHAAPWGYSHCRAPAAAKDLVGVYEDAVQSDPAIRQANANRLAAREARPQAWAACCRRSSAPRASRATTTPATRTRSRDQPTQPRPCQRSSARPFRCVLPLPTTIDTTTRNWAVNLRSNLFSWTNWMNIKAASEGSRAGRGQLPGRRAGPDPARRAGLLRRAARPMTRWTPTRRPSRRSPASSIRPTSASRSA